MLGVIKKVTCMLKFSVHVDDDAHDDVVSQVREREQVS